VEEKLGISDIEGDFDFEGDRELQKKRDEFYRAALEYRYLHQPVILGWIDSSPDLLWQAIAQEAMEDSFESKTGYQLKHGTKRKRGRPKGSSGRVALRSLVDHVLSELEACHREYPNNHVRLIGYDNYSQSQGMSFVVFRGK